MTLKLDAIAGSVGGKVEDEYGRQIGTLVSVYSNVDGTVQAIEVKIVDRGIEKIPGDRVKIQDGRILVVPEWKYEALKAIESLDRAYRRRKAIESIASQSDIPGDVLDAMRRKLGEEIKRLKVEADKAKRRVKDRIAEIEDELLHVASAIANLQMLYFSGEVWERGYTQGMSHLRKLRESLTSEKEDAKKTLDKLEKTIEIASTPFTSEAKKPQVQAPQPKPVKPAGPAVQAPSKQEEGLVVKIEE